MTEPRPKGFNQKVYDFQKALPAFGVKYTIPSGGEGISDPAFKIAIKTLEVILQNKTNEPFINKIMSGSTLMMSASDVASKYFNKDKSSQNTSEQEASKAPSTQIPSQPSPSIKSLQQLLSEQLPIAGKLYSGPLDGIVNKDLESAAQKLESIIAKETGKPASGLIWNTNSKSFVTTSEDIRTALNLLQNKTKSAFTHDERFLKFAEILQKQALSVNELNKLLSIGGTFGIMSPYISTAKIENKSRLTKLVQQLQDFGCSFEFIKGQWFDSAGKSSTEKSLIIKDIDPAFLFFLGQEYEQDAVIYKNSDGLIGMYYLKQPGVEVAIDELGQQKIKYSLSKDLWSKTQGISFEFDFLWGQKLPWDGATPLTLKDIKNHIESNYFQFQSPASTLQTQ